MLSTQPLGCINNSLLTQAMLLRLPYVCVVQRVMQNDAAVFRTGETLQEGCQKIDETVASFSDVKVGHVT
jgi:hypothetical protein